ncbi:hypothetical protein H1R20_g828, partial [Candolleomyces eurysporus]
MLTPGAGLGDGEAPERGWGELNPLATSTQEMGPGTRRNTLDYHFRDYNWRKIIRLGNSLLKKMVTATSDVAEHVIAHQELEATLDREQLQSWMEAMTTWELDLANPNPYELYVPTSVLLRKREPQKKEKPKPFDVQLWLPSQIGTLVSFDRSLAEIEYKLRNAQAHEALGILQRNLQIRATLYDVKDRWLRGQGANTRALNAIATVQARIAAARDEYRQARDAILALAALLSHQNVDQEFLPLEEKDIRSMTEAEPGQGETRRKLSWIWRHVNAADATEEETKAFVTETIRVEWGKSRARAQRYQEEIKLVREEMDRTLRFFVWKAADWHAKGDAPRMELIPDEYSEGLKAYAERQASLCQSLHDAFKEQWKDVPSLIKSANDEIEKPNLFYRQKQQEF